LEGRIDPSMGLNAGCGARMMQRLGTLALTAWRGMISTQREVHRCSRTVSEHLEDAVGQMEGPLPALI
jgi:hypothetical protein